MSATEALRTLRVCLALCSTPRDPRPVFIAKRSDLGRRLMRASARGWREAQHSNMAHSGHWCVGVASDQPVGIDLELWPRRESKNPLILGDDREFDLLGRRDAAARLELFMAKEAALKLGGVGMLEWSRCRLVALLQPKALVLEHGDERRCVQILHQENCWIALCTPGDEPRAAELQVLEEASV